jgi:hypothetical protein
MTAVGSWGAGLAVLVIASCQEPNPEFDGAAAGSGSSSSTGMISTTTATTAMTTTGMGGTSSTSLDPDTAGTTMPVGGSSSGSSGGSSSGPGETTESGSSSSGGEEGLYPPCMLDEDPVCDPPYEECYDAVAGFTACTLPCTEDGDCPQPTTGDAPAVCAGAGNDQCVIDCAGGATCPDGMECQDAGPGGMFQRCLWAR